MIDLSVILVNYKNPPLLRLFLRSLSKVLPNKYEAEVIVVDSASTPETRNVVNHDCAGLFRHISLVHFKANTGYTRGNNEGIRRSLGRYILVLNPDIVPLDGSIEQMTRLLDKNPEIGLVGPQLLNMDGTRQNTCFRFMTPYTLMCRRIPYLPWAKSTISRFLMQETDFSKTQNVDWLMGSAYMTTRRAIQKVGLLDENLFHYMSDVDWPRRFWYHGYTVSYCPEARMYHYHRRESKGRSGIFDIITRRQTRWHLADAQRYFIKHGISGQRPVRTTS